MFGGTIESLAGAAHPLTFPTFNTERTLFDENAADQERVGLLGDRGGVDPR